MLDDLATDDGTADDSLDERRLIRRIQREIDNGIGGDEGDVTDVRQAMFSRYYGEPYGNERPGYSKYVARNVFETVEWALPSLLRIFTGSSRAVSFKARGPDDVAQAKHETEVVNQVFADGAHDSGFMVLYSWLKDILMYPNGYTRVSIVDGEGGKAVLVESLPPDAVVIASHHAHLSLDRTQFVAIRERKTRSDLIEAGYDEDELDELGPSIDDDTWNDERITRHFYVDEDPQDRDQEYDLEADELFWVHECYIRYDADGDGVSELRRVVMAGCKILDNEPIDHIPVIASAAIPIPHKHIGMSYAESVADLQELSTVLIRQMLDSIYKANVSRKYVNERGITSDNKTLDDLLDPSSEVVVTRGNPAEVIQPEVNTPIIADIATVITQFQQAPQLRTGVAPQLTLDPSVLEKSTAGAFLGAMDQASQRLELLARIFAETALVPLFQKIHYLLRTYIEEPLPIEIGGEWVEAIPSQWRPRSNMHVHVGLGFTNKAAKIQLLQSVLMIQREAMGIGLADAKVIYATLEQLIETADMGHARTYFVDPNAQGWQPPAPQEDPAMISAKAQAQALMAEAQRNARKQEVDEIFAREEAEQFAAKQALEISKLKDQARMTDASIAKIMAEITAMNRDDRRQGGPAQDSSADEFAAAKGQKEPKPAPAADNVADIREMLSQRPKRAKIIRGPDGKATGVELESDVVDGVPSPIKARGTVARDEAGAVSGIDMED